MRVKSSRLRTRSRCVACCEMGGIGIFRKPEFKEVFFFFKGVWLCEYAFRGGVGRVPGALVHMLSHSSLEYSRAASRDQKDGCVKEGATREEMWENAALKRERDTQECP